MQSTLSRSFTAAVYAMACGSGFAALVYEVAWARMLALTFGSTTLSAAAGLRRPRPVSGNSVSYLLQSAHTAGADEIQPIVDEIRRDYPRSRHKVEKYFK